MLVVVGLLFAAAHGILSILFVADHYHWYGGGVLQRIWPKEVFLKNNVFAIGAA